MLEHTCDGKSSKAPLLFQVARLADGCGGRENYRLQDEAILESLHFSDHLCLVIWGAVVMNDTESTEKRHVDGHLMFGDSVHGRGEKWSFERDALGHRGV